jgi:hypothetical protein
MNLGVILVLALLGSGICGSIAYAKLGTTNSFLTYFVLGLVFMPISFIMALMVKRPIPAPPAPGWYADPWGHAAGRFWDGAQWTGHTDPGNVPAQQP